MWEDLLYGRRFGGLAVTTLTTTSGRGQWQGTKAMKDSQHYPRTFGAAASCLMYFMELIAG